MSRTVHRVSIRRAVVRGVDASGPRAAKGALHDAIAAEVARALSGAALPGDGFQAAALRVAAARIVLRRDAAPLARALAAAIAGAVRSGDRHG